ncbi:MAG: MFS transporter [Acidimicrobiales bacterium]
MHQVVVRRVVTERELQAILEPRDDLVRERRCGDGLFELADGPFSVWRRTVRIDPSTGTTTGAQVTVTETFEFRLAVPVWSVLFRPLLRHHLRRGTDPDRGRVPWWAPPQRLDRRSAKVLGLLSVVALIAGYLGTLLSQTNTFFKEDFGASDAAIGATLSVVRIGALLALVVAAVADRRGRRRVLLAASVAGCVATASGTVAPGLVWLGASQTVARAFSTAMALIFSIIAVEETPAGSRAYAVSVLTMAGALGAGAAVMLLWVADLGAGTWRLLYAVPLVALVPLRWVARHLPETRRFSLSEQRSSTGPNRPRARLPRGRLALLAASGLFLSVFVAPASGFQNEYLRSDRGFSAVGLIAFNILTNTPGGLGIVVGGRLADAIGRRLIGALGLAAGVGFTVLVYLDHGWTIWLWSVLAAALGAMAVPALAVYGPELFATEARGRANGIINLFSVIGSAAGLYLAGVLADRLGSLSEAMFVLAAAPLVVIALVLLRYPETASLELEELNPEDAPLSRDLLALEGLDVDSIAERYPPRTGGPEPDR